jgi:hypothetical protein
MNREEGSQEEHVCLLEGAAELHSSMFGPYSRSGLVLFSV